MKLLRARNQYGRYVISVHDLGRPCEYCQGFWRDMGGRDGVDQAGRSTGGVLDKGYIYLYHESFCRENLRSDAEFLAFPRNLSPTNVSTVLVTTVPVWHRAPNETEWRRVDDALGFDYSTHKPTN